MDMWKEAGVIVIPVVASVALAKLMERGGASAVIAEGMESGGHIGAQTTMTLVPQVVDAVSIPVIAAGGIADNRGFNAAFALGAEAVQMGTRFVTAKESIVHENYKQKVIKAKDIDSEVTGMSTGHPIRVLRNKMTRQYLKLEKEGAPFEAVSYTHLDVYKRQGMHCAIVSVNIADMDSAEVSDILMNEYGIATRSGIHCAPLMHKFFGTQKQGMVRFSFSYYNTNDEINEAAEALMQIAALR